LDACPHHSSGRERWAIRAITCLLAAGSRLAKTVPVLVALATVGVVLAATLRWGHAISRLVFTLNDEMLLLVVLGLAPLVLPRWR
jgi:hypothetical protein